MNPTLKKWLWSPSNRKNIIKFAGLGALLLVLKVTGVIGPSEDALDAGDCFQGEIVFAGDEVKKVDCAENVGSRTFIVMFNKKAEGKEYPGTIGTLEAECESQHPGAEVSLPSGETWADDDRNVICYEIYSAAKHQASQPDRNSKPAPAVATRPADAPLSRTTPTPTRQSPDETSSAVQPRGGGLSADGTCPTKSLPHSGLPSKETRPFLEQFVITMCSGDREALKPFMTEAALGEYADLGLGPPEDGAKIRLNWFPECEPGSSGPGSCSFTMISPEGGGFGYEIYYNRTPGAELTIRSFEALGGGA